ncbi:hypothetical protein PORCRE_1205 [Porphyromonas crevioricanis JCM 15906]|uniref:Uncharacterized protein n=1 Tax=Porphyromonas crevioricanis JCM 15906 TaxID=1305617 RepID=T1CNS5_9PORP|nr:hypothetical protein PORCRE_1205 [Porphyromonas crevioricanis JCM 15906]GAD07728.1 hypothetical protein PORCAN_1353 [Porphyromonas crevioricanis JCM 13913]
MLTQEKKIISTGENFRSLPCQQKTSPYGIKIETKKEA